MTARAFTCTNILQTPPARETAIDAATYVQLNAELLIHELQTFGRYGFSGDLSYRLEHRQFRRHTTDVLKESAPAPDGELLANHKRHGALLELWAHEPGQTMLEIAMSHGLITRVRVKDRSDT